jgi:hypothetical protein
MDQRQTPELVIPRDQIEILPADPSDQGPANDRLRVWVSIDAQGNNHRVYLVKPGPIATILLALIFGTLAAVTLVVLLGLFAVFACVSGLLIAGSLLYGLLRGSFHRLR